MGTRSAPTATPGHHGDPPPASQVITTIDQAYGIPEKILSPDVIVIKYFVVLSFLLNRFKIKSERQL